MHKYFLPSLILVAVCLSVLAIPQASALPVSYNQTSLNFGLTSVPRNSSSYDVFTLDQDNWLWEKFDNNTVDSGPLSVVGTVTYNTNLKALYKFENTITDSTTNGRTLTKAAGTQTFTTSGAEGNAIVLDGSTYYTASDTGLPSGNNAWSISCWVKPSNSNQLAISSWGTNAGNQAITFKTNGGSLQLDNVGSNLLTSATHIANNVWTYVTVTYDGTTIKMYINGVLDANTATPSALNIVLSGATGLKIGTNPAVNINFNGNIDEHRIYNIALSQAQVSALDMVGHYSQSHTFDGGEYVSLGNVFPFTNTTPFTFTFWVNKPSSATAGNELISKGGDGLGGYEVYYPGTTLEYRLWDGGPTHQISATVGNDAYHYVAVTYDGSGNFLGMKIYVDGVFQTQGTSSTIGAFTDAYPVCMGISCGDFANPLQGQLDNVKVYPYALSSSQITSDYNSISPISSGKQFMSWYNGISGSSTLTQKLGSTKSTLTTACSLSSGIGNYIVSNLTKIYYHCGLAVKTNDIVSGTSSHVYTAQDNPATANNYVLFATQKHIFSYQATTSTSNGLLSWEGGNGSNLVFAGSGNFGVTDEALTAGNTGSIQGLYFNQNATVFQTNPAFTGTTSTPVCTINYTPTNTTKALQTPACDVALPAMTVKYWNGMMIQKVGNYKTNSTQQFLSSIDASGYKKLLSVPCLILVNESPCSTFIMSDFTNTDYFVVLTSTHVYYRNAQSALNYLLHNNYALQSYDVITTATTSAFEIPNPILQSMTLYGFNLNTTVTNTGLFTLPSGYSIRSTIVAPSVRLIDPRWTNDLTDIPIISSTSSLFPIYLTASNAPSFSAIKVTSAQQILNSQEAVWAVAQLDSTRSVEFDLPAGTCANIYIADISVSPSVWNFEGIICATGVNQKTIAYTNTVPFTFYTLKYGVTDSYVPANNGLQTTFRTQAAPTTYTVIVRNSTGTVAINQTFTIPANQTVDTRTFNVSSVSKPAALSVSVGGNLVYSAYLGSALSLATMASFFHQYFSYQGFDLLSMIPVVLAAAFTRNTVGAGMVIVVLVIATLSWLSVTVVPEPVVYVSIFISVLGIIGYKAFGY